MTKKLLILLLGCFITIFYITFVETVSENIYINSSKNYLIKNAVFDENLSTSNQKVYVLKTNNELYKDDLPYTLKDKRLYPGGAGDIILTRESAFENSMLDFIISGFVGGHAALSCFNTPTTSTNDCIEVNGMTDDDVVSVVPKDYWNYDFLYDEVYSYRVKFPKEQRYKAFQRAYSVLGQKYDYSFMFQEDTKKYCSSLMSYAYMALNINLNYDGFATTVLDLAVSKYVELSYYSYVKDGIRYIYTLSY